MTGQDLDWHSTNDEWTAFLDEVRAARATVGSTYAGAWFRGQTHDWPLIPSLFRASEKVNRSIQELDKQRAEVSHRLKGATRFAKKNKKEPDDRIKELEAQLVWIDGFKKRLLCKLPNRTSGAVHGEGRAFIEYRFRSGCHHLSSWQTLAEMQHYGIPTRLLDWTESFTFALAFALRDYVAVLESRWTEERDHFSASAETRRLKFHNVEAMAIDGKPKTPTLWILNPYRMANVATGEEVLWDLTARSEDDYFMNFIERGHLEQQPRFVRPVPMLAAWRDERIAAQQGVFTCFGAKAEPLDQLFSKRVLRSVRISPAAAVHGVRFLYEFGGLDAFTMFRDRDHLGEKTKKEFFREHSLS